MAHHQESTVSNNLRNYSRKGPTPELRKAPSSCRDQTSFTQRTHLHLGCGPHQLSLTAPLWLWASPALYTLSESEESGGCGRPAPTLSDWACVRRPTTHREGDEDGISTLNAGFLASE